jgi:hypothetical protein
MRNRLVEGRPLPCYSNVYSEINLLATTTLPWLELIIGELIVANQGNFSFQKINNKVGDSQKRWKPLK